MPNNENEEDIDDVDGDDNTNDTEDNTGEGKDKESQTKSKTETETNKQDNTQKAANRKGYEMRKGLNNELEALKAKVEELESNLTTASKDQEFRKSHPEISDEVFNSLKAQSKGSGKTYDEVLEDPVFKGFLKSEVASNRVEGAHASPSTRTGSSTSSYKDMSNDEFNAKMREVQSRG